MKRNIRLAILILEAMIDPSIVGCKDGETVSIQHFGEYDGSDVQYHFDMLHQHGCFFRNPGEDWSTVPFASRFLSWKGHDLLQKLKETE